MSSVIEETRSRSAAAFDVDAYRGESAAERMVPVFLDMMQGAERSRVLDAGCGTGRGMVALAAAGFEDVRGCDITPVGLVPEAQSFEFTTACLWADPVTRLGLADWVYCCDVLECVPEALTMLVVHNLLHVARWRTRSRPGGGVFLTMSTEPDVHGVWVGASLRQTVKPFTWWLKHLETVGQVVSARDMLNRVAFMVERRVAC